MNRTEIKRIRWMLAPVLLVAVASGSAALADDHRDNADMYQLIRPIAESVRGSVVQILSGGTPVALGTVVTEDGYVLTKRSELSGDPIRIRLSDKRLLPARVAAVRRRNDLALLRIESAVAVPPIQFSNVAPPIASFLISPGRTGRPLGLGVVSVKPRQVQHQGRLGVMLRDDSSGRALVDEVFPHSGAERAGIIIGDLIIAIDGREKNTRTGVIETLREKFPGERVRLTILRTNASRGTDTLEMDARIREFGIMAESESDSRVNGPRNVRLSGFEQAIQHDTVLDPDECGGPVLDTSGRVVGLNIARAGRVVSYALPGSLVTRELDSMLQEARAAAR